MCDVVSNDTIGYIECLLDELGPTFIAIPGASDDAGHYSLHVWVNQVIAAVAPANQGVPDFNGFERFIPVPIEKVAKDLRNPCTPKRRMGCIQTGDESIISGWLGA